MIFKELFENISRRGFLKGVAGAAVVGTTAKAHAKGNWVLLKKEGQGAFFVDVNSIAEVAPNTYEFWDKIVINGREPGMLRLSRIDVKRKTYSGIGSMSLDHGFKIGQPEKIEPDSPRDEMLDFLVKHLPK